MKIKNILDCERKSAQKFLNFQLPHTYKNIGWIVFVSSFAILILAKFFIEDMDTEVLVKSISKYAILIGLLIVSLSKEVIEDEYIKSLRMQSYMFAFLFAVIAAFIVPFINFGAETLVDGTSAMQGLDDFVIIWTLLFCQIFYFNVLKKGGNDE